MINSDYEKHYYKLNCIALSLHIIAFNICTNKPFLFVSLGILSGICFITSLYYLYKWWFSGDLK